MEIDFGFLRLIVFLLCICADVSLGIFALRKKSNVGYIFGSTCFLGGITTVSLLLMYFSGPTLERSILGSLHFISMDVMLLFVLLMLLKLAGDSLQKSGRFFFIVSAVLVTLLSILFIVNPFHEIVVGYEEVAGSFMNFHYIEHPFFKFHVLLAFAIGAVCVVSLVGKAIEAPGAYKNYYLVPLVSVGFVILFNLIFLALPRNAYVTDFNIVLFTLCLVVFYWSCFWYTTHGLLNYFKGNIFESVNQGIVLFDRNNRLILCNGCANSFLDGKFLADYTLLDDFLKNCGIAQLLSDFDKNVSFQCFVKNVSMRCDYFALKCENSKPIGKLFIFTNISLETDLLTDFQNLDAFKAFAKNSKSHAESEKIVVSVCDIIGLSMLNSSQNRNEGDSLIKDLAVKLREAFPKKSHFVRGNDAILIVVSRNMEENEALDILKKLEKSVSSEIAYAVGVGTRSAEGFQKALDDAVRAMQQKKLLNTKSFHSSAISSLIRALKECDDDTEAHVKRTQMMGAELGKRLKLSDVQQSDLLLLCLLHDIGKIGIPLEILNKPGKLTNEEWNIMKSHAEKGYQIANSSAELKGIADMIGCHHERWDGKGYPRAIAGEQIPLLSRVISVVDSYDAMVSKRVYKKAMSQEDAIAELEKCAGTQFDPQIVAEFIAMLKEHPEFCPSNIDESSDGAAVNGIMFTDLFKAPEKKRECVHIVEFMNYVLDADTFRIRSVNKAFEEISGYTQKDVDDLKLTQKDMIPLEDQEEYLNLVGECFKKGPIVYFEHRFVRKNGNIIFVLCMGRMFFDSASKSARIEVIVIDSSNTYMMQQINEMRADKAERQLRYWENNFRKDSLTGLLNRASFQSEVEQKLQNEASKVMFLMVDVDRFKEYNDTYGHHAGDEFLILVAQTLLSSLRDCDISCRVGGDEFAVALFFKGDCANEFMYKRARQIFDKINMLVHSATRGTTISMGAAIVDKDCRTFGKIFEMADKALLKSKKDGRGRLTTSDEM